MIAPSYLLTLLEVLFYRHDWASSLACFFVSKASADSLQERYDASSDSMVLNSFWQRDDVPRLGSAASTWCVLGEFGDAARRSTLSSEVVTSFQNAPHDSRELNIAKRC